MRKLLSDFSDVLRDSFNRETRLHGSPRKIWYIVHKDELDSVGVSELAKLEYKISEMQQNMFNHQLQLTNDEFGSLTNYMSYVKKVEKNLTEERKARNQESTENLEMNWLSWTVNMALPLRSLHMKNGVRWMKRLINTQPNQLRLHKKVSRDKHG